MNIELWRDTGGDWEALYVDRRLVAEGHSLSTRVVLSGLGHSYDEREIDMQSIDWEGCPASLLPLCPQGGVCEGDCEPGCRA